NARELAGGFRVQALLLDDETLDGDYRRRGVPDHADRLRCGMCSSTFAAQPARRVGARVGLITIAKVAAPHTFPQVRHWKGNAGCKLLNVPELVQEQFGLEDNLRRKKHHVPE